MINTPRHRKHKHKQFHHSLNLPYVNCLECGNCLYIGEGDYLCDIRMKIIISDHDLSTSHRHCGDFILESIGG
jgi:ribosomal protein S27E